MNKLRDSLFIFISIFLKQGLGFYLSRPKFYCWFWDVFYGIIIHGFNINDMWSLYFLTVRTSFDSNLKIRMNSGLKSSNNKFVESERKNWSEFKEKILVDSVKRKELHMHKYKKHHRLCSNSMINGLGFFLPFYYCISSTSLFLFVFLLSFLFIPFSVIYHDFCAIFIIHVWVRSWELLCPIPHLLECSTLSCKAACLLFRNHLHINAARELAGQHLMRRQ